jgi:transposase InsO family protein
MVLRRPIETGQYVSFRYADQLTRAGITASVGSVGDSYDNALAEALNGTLKAELIEPHGPWSGLDELRSTLVRWIGWYNRHRLHSAIGYLPPAEYEANWHHHQAQTHAG